MAEMQSMGYLLFLAGLDTVVSGISFCLWHLARRPDLQQRLSADPTLVSPFVEEILRRFGIAPNYRQVQENVQFADVDFRKGDMLMCLLPVSGLDPLVNPDPLTFDIDRKGSKHLAFSVGPHSCLGQVLARMEMKVAVEEWLKQIPRFSLVDEHCAPPAHGGAVIGFEAVNLRWG
jgi:cytochrome P450